MSYPPPNIFPVNIIIFYPVRWPVSIFLNATESKQTEYLSVFTPLSGIMDKQTLFAHFASFHLSFNGLTQTGRAHGDIYGNDVKIKTDLGFKRIYKLQDTKQ